MTLSPESALADSEGLVPHNIEAEQAFLGALLYDNEIWHKVADWLSPEQFYDPVHARIYAACASRIARGSLADAVALKTAFERDEGLKEIGGAVYLAELMREAPDPEHAHEYARLVHDLAVRRGLVSLHRNGLRAVAQAGVETEASALVDGVEADLTALSQIGAATRRGPVGFATAIGDAVAMAAAAYKRGTGLSGLSTGLSSLDAKLGGLHPSDLLILAGRPSMGKSALAVNIAWNIASAWRAEEDPDTGARRTVDGGIVGFWSLEMSQDQLAMRILADRTGIAGNQIREGRINAAQFETIAAAAEEIAGVPLHIDDQGGIAIGQLAARARRIKRTTGLDVIVVDYLQLLTPNGRRGNSRVEDVSEITAGLKALAKELHVPVIALSQLSRQVENREDKRPQLSDLRESGTIEQDADAVMFVYREAYYLERLEPKEGTEEHLKWEDAMRAAQNTGEVIIGKQRHGPIGTVKLAFDARTTRWSDLEGGKYE